VSSESARFVCLVDRERATLAFTLDGAAATARDGDTILTAVLARQRVLSDADGARAGFCLMGACQECWVVADGRPARACATLVTAGMQVITRRHGG
jgi:predicted molibdopterin-dependent oxidoreductase YjgC